MSMKIFHICPRYYPAIGGVEEHVRNICERLAAKYEIHVLTTDPSGILPRDELINNVKVKRFPSWAPNEAYFFSKTLRKFLADNSKNLGIMHAHCYGAFPALYAAQNKQDRKLVFTPHYHGSGHTFLRSLLHVPYKFFGKKIFEKADKIVCVSNYEKSLVVSNFELDEKKIVVIPNGVNKEEFKDLKKPSNDRIVILSVGRLEKYKGMQYLIQALPRINREIRLEIVGKGPYKKNLIKLTKKLGIASKVSFFQDLPRNELLQKYAAADVFVLLSQHEAYGISVAEALCAGTPCIVAKTSALSEWVDNKNCFGVDYPIDIDQLVEMINFVAGKEVLAGKFIDWDVVVEKLIALYENC